MNDADLLGAAADYPDEADDATPVVSDTEAAELSPEPPPDDVVPRPST